MAKVKVIVYTLVGIGISLFFSSCSVMMPYHEHFQCRRGNNVGYCGPVGKVYQETVIEQQKGVYAKW